MELSSHITWAMANLTELKNVVSTYEQELSDNNTVIVKEAAKKEGHELSDDEAKKMTTAAYVVAKSLIDLVTDEKGELS